MRPSTRSCGDFVSFSRNKSLPGAHSGKAGRTSKVGWIDSGVGRNADGPMRKESVPVSVMERPMRIELTPEPWQGSVLPLY